jgi:hypothetical protein
MPRYLSSQLVSFISHAKVHSKTIGQSRFGEKGDAGRAMRMEIADKNLPSSVDREQRPIRNTAFVSRDVAVETIVVPICKGVRNLDSASPFNSLSRGLWLLLEEGCTTEELANWVATHSEVLGEQAVADVRSYLTDLREIGFIRTVY